MNVSQMMPSFESVRAAMPGLRPHVVMVLGSGWLEAISGFKTLATLSYAELPGMGVPQVAGHAGQLVQAEREGLEVLVFAGRRHWYEGVGWLPIALPVALAHALGAKIVVLTNSAGAIRPAVAPGTLMVIDDHINAMGANPLLGPHDAMWGPRFPDMSRVYDAALRERLDRAAHRARVGVMHGVYMAVSGPAYETPAEVNAFRRLGADAVGMSTVPEAMLAHAAGLRVAGLSCITNAAGATHTLSHQEVLMQAAGAVPAMQALLHEFMALTAREDRS
jgi:purine-nucleoside phosphorylase